MKEQKGRSVCSPVRVRTQCFKLVKLNLREAEKYAYTHSFPADGSRMPTKYHMHNGCASFWLGGSELRRTDCARRANGTCILRPDSRMLVWCREDRTNPGERNSLQTKGLIYFVHPRSQGIGVNGSRDALAK